MAISKIGKYKKKLEEISLPQKQLKYIISPVIRIVSFPSTRSKRIAHYTNLIPEKGIFLWY